LPIVAIFVVMIVGALLLRGATISVPRLNRAMDAYWRADFAEARAILEEADKASRAVYIARLVDLQRAEIAWALGDLNSAHALVELAANRSARVLATKVHDGSALALRALVRAARGEVEEARLDVERMRKHPAPLPGALGRAELAEAIVLARAGDRGALEHHLDANRELLRHVVPRERALARVLERFALGGHPPPLRTEAPVGRACGEVPSLRAWMAKVLPIDLPAATEPEITVPPMQPMEGDAASFGAATDALGRPIPISPAKGRAARNVVLLVALYVLLVLTFLSFWWVLQPNHPARPAHAETDEPNMGAR
jgi:hypothetical protein